MGSRAAQDLVFRVRDAFITQNGGKNPTGANFNQVQALCTRIQDSRKQPTALSAIMAVGPARPKKEKAFFPFTSILTFAD